MHNAITLDALQVLDAIDRQGSFSAAAQALHKVPSALTYTVQKLEADLGTVLFDRSKKQIRLTAAGQLVLSQGRELLQAARRLEDGVRQLDSGWESQLRIARDTVLPLSPLLAVVQRFLQLDRQVDIALSEEVLGGGWDALQHRRVDLVIGATGELPRGAFEVHAIGELQFVFAVAAAHPLAAVETRLSVQQLRQYPAVIVADSSQTLPARSSGLFDSKQRLIVDSMAAKIAVQEQGLGIGFVPRHLVQSQLASGALVEKACEWPRPDQPLYLAWRKGEQGKALAWFARELCCQVWCAPRQKEDRG